MKTKMDTGEAYMMVNMEYTIKLEQQNAALVEVAKDVEWIFTDDSLIRTCPWCHNGQIQGHSIDCQRQQALALVEGE